MIANLIAKLPVQSAIITVEISQFDDCLNH
jgi:hypothetical protein